MTKTMREIVAGTRWTIEQAPHGAAWLVGDDFAHDVTLHVSGDFVTPAEAVDYAQALADRLNGGTE